MKKLMLTGLATCLVGMVALTSCSLDEYAEENAVTVNSYANENDNISVWTDEKTGVQYIVYREKYMNAGFGGITPRLNSDGTLYTEPTEAACTDEEG